MKGAYIVGLGDLTLREITPETVYEARVKIQCRIEDPAVRALITDMICPTPHTVEADPSQRRALPRRSA